MKDLETFTPTNIQQWRKWLQRNYNIKQAVWLVMYKKDSGMPVITWSDAVDEALCYGWIDGRRKTLDEQSFIQHFSRRKPTSTWSKINKAKVERLIAEGRMAAAGMECIEVAKQNGSWNVLDDVEELVVPKDLLKELKLHPGAKKFFDSLSRSVKKMMLHWIHFAKRPETRQKRIIEIASLAAQGKKPKGF